MFIILVDYQVPLEEIEAYLIAHRAFLNEGYLHNAFIASGPRNPRDGGVILSQLRERTAVEAWIERDPFYIQALAEYEIIEFDPIKYHPDFLPFIEVTPP